MKANSNDPLGLSSMFKGLQEQMSGVNAATGPEWAKYVAPVPQPVTDHTIPKLVVTGMMMHACVSGKTLHSKYIKIDSTNILQELFDDIKSKAPLVYKGEGISHFVSSDTIITLKDFDDCFTLDIYTFDDNMIKYLNNNIKFHGGE